VGSSLQVLYRDEACVAVLKPPGLLVHPTPGFPVRDTVLRRLRGQLGRWVYPVHRLDRATSGVLVMALGPEAAEGLCRGFREGGVDKLYHAVVRGFTEPQGRIDLPLRGAGAAPDRPALTEYRRLATVELPIPVGPYATARYSLLELRPRTGRTHQIRRHLKHIAHPIVGDTVHGDGRHNRMFRERLGVRRLLLHATEIGFRSPATGQQVQVRAPFDPGWLRLMERLGWGGVLEGGGDPGAP